VASNYPPGCKESDIPGNLPKDREIEISVVLAIGELRCLKSYTFKEACLIFTPSKILQDVFHQITSTPIE
jgi:hypothetical protein